jgi:hypothetical protein
MTAVENRRPNGLAFSCRERAAAEPLKSNDLAREAVCCNAGLGRSSIAHLPQGICVLAAHNRWFSGLLLAFLGMRVNIADKFE